MLPEAPAISPEGQRIAFLTHDPAKYSDQIVVIPSGGGVPVKIANAPGFCAFQWTPAGDAVAYVRRKQLAIVRRNSTGDAVLIRPAR